MYVFFFYCTISQTEAYTSILQHLIFEVIILEFTESEDEHLLPSDRCEVVANGALNLLVLWYPGSEHAINHVMWIIFIYSVIN